MDDQEENLLTACISAECVPRSEIAIVNSPPTYACRYMAKSVLANDGFLRHCIPGVSCRRVSSRFEMKGVLLWEEDQLARPEITAHFVRNQAEHRFPGVLMSSIFLASPDKQRARMLKATGRRVA
jgi:hypothetical protein